MKVGAVVLTEKESLSPAVAPVVHAYPSIAGERNVRGSAGAALQTCHVVVPGN